MDLENFEPGSVRRRNEGGVPIRILVCSDGMAQYDVWQSAEGAWGISDLKAIGRKNIFYYTTTVASLERNTTFSERAPLTPQETGIHRPDLAFTAASSAAQSWLTVDPERVDGPDRLPAAEIFLRPFTRSGSSGRMERIKADDGSSFTRAELVRRGQEMLSGEKDVVDGVGIHRLGIRQGIPSYYLWGFAWKGAPPRQ